MIPEAAQSITIICNQCSFQNVFNQPYRIHAGFGDEGFLYNESGNKTLTWSSFDPDYIKIVGKIHPWRLSSELQRKFENILKPDPSGGGKWLFSNPARCLKCAHPISDPITKDSIEYLRYEDGYLLKDVLRG